MDYEFTMWLEREIRRLYKGRNSHLAAKMDVTPSAVGDWLNGTTTPKPHHLMKLAELTGKNPFVLFNWVYNLPLPTGGESANIEDALESLRPKERAILEELKNVNTLGLEIVQDFIIRVLQQHTPENGDDERRDISEGDKESSMARG